MLAVSGGSLPMEESEFLCRSHAFEIAGAQVCSLEK